MPQLTIGIDVGTTAVKAVLFDPDVGILARTQRPSTLHSDGPGLAEADPTIWEQGAYDAIRELIVRTPGVSAGDVAALSTTGMVPALVLADAAGRPLGRAILQSDARAVEELRELAAAFEHIDLVAETGSALTQQSVAPTGLWLRRHDPVRWAGAAHVQGSYDWLLRRLGARPHVEQNWGIESGLFRLDGSRQSAVFEAAGIDDALVPALELPTAVVGNVGGAAGRETGLPRSVQLVVGGADHVLSAFAAGVERPGDWLIKLGGAGDILTADDAPTVDARVYLDAHPRPGLWLPNGCMATSGSLIRWFQAVTGEDDLLRLDVEAGRRRPAEAFCLPYFLGEKSPLHDPELRGVFAGLGLQHTTADLFRAVLEAIAFGFRHHVEIFRERGLAMESARITNGGSASTLWKQIHADVLGVELSPVVDHPGASLGAAVLAAVGVGLLPSWDAVHSYSTLGEPVVPDPGVRERYDEAYRIWRELGEATTPVSHRMAVFSR